MKRTYDPISLFQEAVREWPHRPALQLGERTWTYAELDALSRKVAAWCDANCAAGERVAIMGQRNVLAYAGILGVLRSGRPYVPLHPHDPEARWKSKVERSGARALIVDSETATSSVSFEGTLICDPSAIERTAPSMVDRSGPEAYLMFTSGSTGVPKGVPVGRAQVSAYLAHMLGTYPFVPEDRFSQFFALSFDLSVHDLFVCWGAGACLCVPLEEGPLRAAAFTREQRITVWFSVPSLLAVMQRMGSLRPAAFPAVRMAFFCGEALRTSTALAWRKAAPNARLVNLYGPTETTIAITAYEVDPQHPPEEVLVPIGRPFPGHEARILNDHGLTDDGEGELVVGGLQVNAGYLGDPDTSAHAFISIEGDHMKWYRTGDRVRTGPSGLLHYLGRMDDQVKVNGHRVEPGEVDACLMPLLQGGNAVTVPVENAGAVSLVTFIDVPLDTGALFRGLHAKLPSYMVPERIIHVAALPYNAHGKLDRKALIERAANG